MSAPVLPSPTPSPSLQRLQRALDELPVATAAEERGALAIVTPRAPAHTLATADVPALSLDAATRRAIVQSALAAGFSHVALEIPLPDSAPVPQHAPPCGGPGGGPRD